MVDRRTYFRRGVALVLLKYGGDAALIAIASIDDVVESAYTRPPLTTFRIPKYEMGVLAMQKLQRLIGNEQEIAVKSIVYGELVVRESCGTHISYATERTGFAVR